MLVVVNVIDGDGFNLLYISDLKVVNEQKINMPSRLRSKST